MAKSLENIMEQELAPLLNKDEVMDYYVYGKIAATSKKMIFLVIGTIVSVLVCLFILPVNLLLKLVLCVLILVIAIKSFTCEVYLGKFGKRLFICEKNLLGNIILKDEIPLKQVAIDSARSGDTHYMLMFILNEKFKYILIKKNMVKDFYKQTENVDKLITDILKKANK